VKRVNEIYGNERKPTTLKVAYSSWKKQGKA